jgi:hypothetical protein
MAAPDSRHLPPVRPHELWPGIYHHLFRRHHLLPPDPLFILPSDEQAEEVRHHRGLPPRFIHDDLLNYEGDTDKSDCIWQWQLYHARLVGQR